MFQEGNFDLTDRRCSGMPKKVEDGGIGATIERKSLSNATETC